jgi:signal transduction histidine kinase/ActR/RegA family two-component response regulator
LEKRVAERTEALENINRQLTQEMINRKKAEEGRRELEERLQRAEKMEALGMLAGGVAHDLNNDLGIIVGYSELLLDAIGKSSAVSPYIINIMSGGERAAAIVQDMLTLARRGVRTERVVNLSTTIIDCLKTPEFERLCALHPDFQIKTNLDSGLLNIMGSPVHLSKTVMNLVTNAAEAMPNGGTLTMATSNQYLDRPVQGYDHVREGEYVVIAVSDTGGGIPAADMKHIFEPFYTRKVMGKSGTGLGLSVVWSTVKDHDGYIDVRSEEGRGTSFTLYFPVTRGKISEDQVAASMSEYMGNGESILVVDDIEGQRELAFQMLNKLNYRVATVGSGEDAVEYVKENTVDLILLDMIMEPSMDGLDTYKKILEINPKQKAIIVSGFSETSRVNQAQALGAGAYVKKPYILERLGLAVRKELMET